MTSLLFYDDPYASETETVITSVGEDGSIVVEQTVFYPTGGGQPGDSGTLVFDGGKLTIVEALKGDGGVVRHRLADGGSAPPPGTPVKLILDWERRHRHMRMHTLLHLLCASVTGDVTGGQIGAEKSRLDFNIGADAVDKEALTARLNELIQADHVIGFAHITEAELEAQPDLVRTMSVKPPRNAAGTVRLVRIGPESGPVDLQPCGGTHVKTTAEIGEAVVSKIENKGKQNRRISVQLV